MVHWHIVAILKGTQHREGTWEVVGEWMEVPMGECGWLVGSLEANGKREKKTLVCFYVWDLEMR